MPLDDSRTPPAGDLAHWLDATWLEDQFLSRGMDALQTALIHRLHNGRATNDLDLPAQLQLETLLRLLQAESAHVAGWQAEKDPVFFAQQIYNRAQRLGLPALVASAAARLDAANRPHLRHQWSVHQDAPARLRSLNGHVDAVNTVAITPDGLWAISGSNDGTLIVWDLLTGAPARVLNGHIDWVSAVVVDPGGEWAISASKDATLRRWHLRSGLCMTVFEGHTAPVRAVALTPDGRRVLSAANDGTLRLWDTHTGDMLGLFIGHTNRVMAVVIDAARNEAISAADDHTLRVWDLNGGALRTIPLSGGYVSALALHPDGVHLVAAADDRTLRVWDVHTGALLDTLHGHAASVRTVALSADGSRILSGDNNGKLILWDLEDGRICQRLEGHSGPITAVAFCPGGQSHRWTRALSASVDRSLALWQLDGEDDDSSAAAHTASIHAIAHDRARRAILTAAEDGAIKVWEANSGQLVQTLDNGSAVLDIAVLPDGERILSGDEDGQLRRWSLAEENPQPQQIGAHRGPILTVAVTPDGHRAITGTETWAIRIWDLASGEAEQTLTLHRGAVYDLVVTANGEQLLSASGDETIRLWRLADGEPIQIFAGHEETVAALALLPDGSGFVSASDDETIRLWSFDSSDPLLVLEGHCDWVNHVLVTPDGAWIFSGGQDGRLYAWERGSGAIRARAQLDAPITALAYGSTEDGHGLVWVGDDRGALFAFQIHCGRSA